MRLFVDGVGSATGTYSGGLGTTFGGGGNFEPLVIGASSWVSGEKRATPDKYPF